MRIALIVVLACLLGTSCGREALNSKSSVDFGGAALVRYLEYVTNDVDGTCSTLSAIHDVEFGEPVAELGNARVAMRTEGNRIGVRAPLAEHDQPIVRAYMLVDDIESAIKQAESAGATVAHPPMEVPGQGTFAIYILGGTQHGLWQDL